MVEEDTEMMNKVKKSKEDRIFLAVCYIIISILTIIVLYPMVYVVSASFSSGSAVAQGKVWLWPVEVTLDGYKEILKYKNIWIGYRNTIFYTVVGTVINVCFNSFSDKNCLR